MNVKDIRVKLNMSQARFAKEYGIPLRTLQSWESGERKPARYIVDLLFRILIAEGRIKMLNLGDSPKVVHIADNLSIAFTAWTYNDKTYYGYAEFLGGPNGYLSFNSFQGGGRNYGDSSDCYERIDEEDYFGDLANVWNMILALDELDGCFDVTGFEVDNDFEDCDVDIIEEELDFSECKKYIVFDDCGTDIYTEEFTTADEAIKYADKEFSRLTKSDLKRRNAFYVLESVNPDPDAPDHWDGNPIKAYL